ncbi:hypothetical protein F4825DRAFT_450042 [Nemania diffusa]|nr:hypothetical protein F4825DRAFT_450042 [Nemania diffusa]
MVVYLSPPIDTASPTASSGLEVVGTALASLQITVDHVSRLLEANRLRKNLRDVLQLHNQELKSTEAVIKVVRAEESLRTADVIAQLKSLEKHTSELSTLLDSLSPGKRDQYALRTKFNQISSSKENLIIQIQVAAVGLQKGTNDKIVVSTEIVKRIDKRLRDLLGDGKGLKLAKAIERRTPQGDGSVLLTDSDLVDIGLKDPNNQTTRGILNNLTWHQATQMNGPIGDDLWKDISKVEIKDNRAGTFSAQINYPVARDDFYSLFVVQFVKYLAVAGLVYLVVTPLSSRSEL